MAGHALADRLAAIHTSTVILAALPAVLAVEAVLAAVLAFVPPLQWVLWFGVGGGWVNAIGGGFVQPLAVAWLGVVVAVGIRQLRAARSQSEEQDRQRMARP